MNEVNVRRIDYVEDTSSLVKRTAKADFKKLGPRLGGRMKKVALIISNFSEAQIDDVVNDGVIEVTLGSESITVKREEIQIFSESTEDMEMAQEGRVTIALDMTLDGDLRAEGYSREIINRIQSMRKEADLNLTDKIIVEYAGDNRLIEALKIHIGIIKKETLASKMSQSASPLGILIKKFEIAGESIELGIALEDT